MLRKIACVAVLFFSIGLAGCASVVSGGSDTVAVTSDPPESNCQVGGTSIRTPSEVTVKHSCSDTLVTCVKDGYQAGSSPLRSTTNWWILGNIVFGGIIGTVIDLASGNACKYDDSVKVTLEPVKGTSP